MQMVSAAKYARAERELKPARVYGTGAKGKLLLSHQQIRNIFMIGKMLYCCLHYAVSHIVSIFVSMSIMFVYVSIIMC